MKLELTVLVLLVGCSTPDPTPMLAEAPDVDIVSVVPAVESPDEALRDTIAVDAPASPRDASDAQALDPAIDRTVAITALEGPVRPNPGAICGKGWMPILGMKFDEANRCYTRFTLGCQPGYAVNSDAYCSVRDDGVVFLGSSSQLQYLGPGWGARPCTPEERGEAGTERPMCAASHAWSPMAP